jgi:hypothetical protein
VGHLRKLIVSDYLSHREVGSILHNTLKEVLASRSSFLDIACGDASMMKSALRGTKVRHYHGIDLSQPALESRPRGRLRAGAADLPRSDRLLPFVPLRWKRRHTMIGGTVFA